MSMTEIRRGKGQAVADMYWNNWHALSHKQGIECTSPAGSLSGSQQELGFGRMLPEVHQYDK